MNLKSKLAANKSKTWFIFTPKPHDFHFSELIDLADWYNNQVLAKSYKNKKVTLSMGEKTLLASSSLLPAARIAVVGLGSGDVKKSDVSDIIKLTDDTLSSLNTDDVWFLVSSQASKEFISAMEKKYPVVLVG